MGSEYPADIDRRKQSQMKLQGLVQTRTQTLAVLAELARSQPFTAAPGIEETLRRFCQALMDYTASAHFQLYRYIADNRERRQSVLAVAEKVYPRIVETTDVILRFNDKYESMSLENSVEFLDVDLSSLGETLAERIQLEDQVISALGGVAH